MKRFIKIMSVYLVFIMIMFISVSYSSNSSNDDRVPINFDTLFPETPYKTAVDSCMQLYVEFNQFSYKKCISQEYDIITDLIVGRLFHIKMCVENIQHQKSPSKTEDVQYLSTLLGELLLEYKRSFSFYLDKPKSGYVAELIQEIKVKLDSFFYS